MKSLDVFCNLVDLMKKSVIEKKTEIELPNIPRKVALVEKRDKKI